MPRTRARAPLIVALALGGACVVCGPARADIYTFTDAAGVVHYTNVPHQSGARRILREPVAPTATSVAGGERYTQAIAAAARSTQIDSALVSAVIAVESAYVPHVVSRRGAMGLMQLMPAVAERYAVEDPFDPAGNILGGARYLRDLMTRFDDNLELAIAAYNAGPEAVVAAGNRIPDIAETRSYVPRVLELYRSLRVRRGAT